MVRRNNHTTPHEHLVALACLVYFHQAVLPPVARNSLTTDVHDTSLDSSILDAEEFGFDTWIQHSQDDHELYYDTVHTVSDDDDSTMEDSRLSLLEFQSDIEVAEHEQLEQHKLAQQLLVTLGSLLRDADRELSSLQDNNLLGSAIVRGCKEIADVVSTIAENLSHDQRLAEASLQDFSAPTDLRLQPELEGSNEHRMMVPSRDNHQQQIAILVDLLQDVEFSLRSIEQEEAEEIADLAVSVALVFVQSLEHAHSQLTPRDLLPPSEFNASRRIELLDDNGEPDFDEENPRPPSPMSFRPVPRVRCLWPPLAPIASDFLQWTKEELFHKQNWVVSTAATLALWPVALTAAMWSVPALAVDHLLQQTYENFDESPVIVGAEVGAAQVQRTALLSFKTAVALAKPTLRVAKRQVQKHGPGVIAAAQEKARHPVSTLHEAAHGTMWCASQVMNFCGEQWQRLQQENPNETLL